MRFFEMKRVPARAAKEKAVRKDCRRNTARQAFAMGSNPMHSTQQAFGSGSKWAGGSELDRDARVQRFFGAASVVYARSITNSVRRIIVIVPEYILPIAIGNKDLHQLRILLSP